MEFEEPGLDLLFGSGREASEVQRKNMGEQRLNAGAVPGHAELVASYPELSSAICTFASGSLTQGWAHGKSDLDLFVVFQDAVQKSDLHNLELLEVRVSTTDPVSWIALGELGQYRADIELWRESQIDELIERFSSSPDKYTVRPNYAEQDLLYRLSQGVSLAGDTWLAQRKETLLASAYGPWLAESQKLDAEGMLEDVEGLLMSGDGESAALAAHRGFSMALHALLALYGDYSSSHKWLYRRLVAAAPTELTLAEGWAALSMSGCDGAPADWAGKTAALIQRLLTAVEKRAL
ncbi:hypothetical protein [Streptomyces sp. NPDC059168]|uniref:hypothetical protein n=1 Tax=Streptomyces sp. NPDC059168 TaxID=3346753 RepID=UPI00367C2F4C